ncbi:DNA/RNA non-specific endonuclease [Streptomyces sp. NPDC002853]
MDAYLWDGSVRFGKLDDLGRPTGAWAALRRDNMKGGSGASSSIWPPGWRGEWRRFNEARGHLLARKRGGPGSGENGHRNLVTSTQNPVNTPVMRGIEKDAPVRHRARSRRSSLRPTRIVRSSAIHGGASRTPRADGQVTRC